VPPFFEGFGKRLVKSPKLYFVHSGLACHLLGIDSERELGRSPFLGPIFEGFVASEILQHQAGTGQAGRLYYFYFRDQQGLEVDFVVPAGHQRLLLVEAKASATALPQMAASLDRLAAVVTRRYRVDRFLVHRPRGAGVPLSALRPGVEAGDLGRRLVRLGR
jgi:predicted AAA+ superfamily ATPase